jgi:predicted Zn-dependent peptidase
VLNAAKNYFLNGKLADYAQIEQKINAITAQQLMQVAEQYFALNNLSQLVFK